VVFFNYTTMQMTAKIVYYGPGLCGKTTNLQAIHQRTAPQSRGDMVSLVRTRNGATTRETIDVVDMVRKGELNRDYEVVGGDIIFVERAPRAYITGEVQRPGPFRLERAMTVRQAMSAGGGLTQRGTQRGLRITRRDPSGSPRTIEAGADDPVQVDDVITVRESWF